MSRACTTVEEGESVLIHVRGRAEEPGPTSQIGCARGPKRPRLLRTYIPGVRLECCSAASLMVLVAGRVATWARDWWTAMAWLVF